MIKRIHEDLLLNRIRTFPVVAMVGARQVGKSTLVQMPSIGQGRHCVTLDDLAALGMAQKDPEGFVRMAARMTIDEVQRAPGILLAIKREVDQNRQPGRYVITGSSDLDMTASLSQSLAGRVAVLPLPTLTWRERNGLTGMPSFLSWLNLDSAGALQESLKDRVFPPFDPDAIVSGGYPSVQGGVTCETRRQWLESYRYTYLERDVRQVSEIGHLSDFARLLELTATRTAQLLNQASLGRDVGLKAATTGRYLSLLEATCQILRLAPYFRNMGKRLVKSPKLYWRDTGLVCHLLGISDWAEAVAANLHGALWETFVVMECHALLSAFMPSARLFFWRTHNGEEVDMMIQDGQRCLPMEIKSAEGVGPADAVALEGFLDAQPAARIGVVLYQGNETRLLSRRVLAVPATGLLL